MVKLEVVDDEAFLEKPETSKNGALFQEEDDDDFTDTDSEISEASDIGDLDESLYDRFSALKDIVPPKTRASIGSIASNTASAVSTGVTYGGKGVWVIISSVLLLGIPYALALSEEQALVEQERQQGLMAEGAQGLMAAGEGPGEAKAAL
ncbi:uncharacterized protein HMPREF1541_09786 [Cyphellophora europaea CBS 101466]|uniref:Mitochondrial import receptor subunit tom22 n=1 Tax=Cyphellophora europaea (strain CBS 101466) TaxID=1220924 RepID=W2S894_CYPE1|nr:uncharacterized protein HMPREF1541_09786 [Cyphellophora europaea CBS 101466]ETN44911.1 hypothetical protein HMPREF1541_09786 [Cyphellophora europaea CBS 101466]